MFGANHPEPVVAIVPEHLRDRRWGPIVNDHELERAATLIECTSDRFAEPILPRSNAAMINETFTWRSSSRPESYYRFRRLDYVWPHR